MQQRILHGLQIENQMDVRISEKKAELAELERLVAKERRLLEETTHRRKEEERRLETLGANVYQPRLMDPRSVRRKTLILAFDGLLVSIRTSANDAPRQQQMNEERGTQCNVPLPVVRQDVRFRAFREETPDWLKTPYTSESSGCSQTTGAEQGHGLLTLQDPGINIRRKPQQKQQNPRMYRKNTRPTRGGVTTRASRAIHTQEGRDTQNVQLEPRTMKKRRFEADSREAISEPSLELNLAMPGGLRTSRSS
ncbi:hypothetical protein R1sor_000980 [Riccia sorocarpa]|uniref:Uncharacterized protein n=1 Tax=Riccia sorocarpa TaxID=122646 RepID=A0ABD3GVJ0_9MARC